MLERRRRARGPAEKRNVDRKPSEAVEHPLENEARIRSHIEHEAGATADESRVAQSEVVLDDRGAGEMDVTVDRPRSRYEAGRGDDSRGRIDDHVDLVLHVGIPGVPDADDPAVLDADVPLDDADNRIEHEDRLDADIETLLRGSSRPGEHPVADIAPGSDQALLAQRHEVPFDARQKTRVAKPDQIPLPGPVERGIERAAETEAHSCSTSRKPRRRASSIAACRRSGSSSSPFTRLLNPRTTRRPPISRRRTVRVSPGS